MLGIDRQQGRAAAGRRVGHQRAGRDQRLLVGERDRAAAPRAPPSPAAARRCRRSPPSSSRRPPAAASIERLARRPRRGSRCRPAAPRARPERVSSPITASRAPVRRAALGQAGDVAAAVSATTSNRSGARSIRSSVERPTEPVAPRMVMLAPHASARQSAPAAVSDARPGAGRRAGRARRHGRAATCRCP